MSFDGAGNTTATTAAGLTLSTPRVLLFNRAARYIDLQANGYA